MMLDLPIVKRPPLRYYGGKFRIAPWIIEHLPAHDNYVEVFGGAAGVLLRKPVSKTEIYNDRDLQVFNFFKILRTDGEREKLIQSIALTPFGRQEFDLSFEASEDMVEAARRFAVRCTFGHGTATVDPADSNGFRSGDSRAGKSYAREWDGIPAALITAAQRMKGVTLENLDFRRLIPKYDGADTVYYVDPPYPLSTRDAGGKGYVHEMSDLDHRDLAWLLKSVKGKVLISGYECRLYAELYKSWHRQEKKTTASGQMGAVPRTEVLWIKP